MYKPGDTIPGLGVVQTNHCGLPWVASSDGNLFYGVLTVFTTTGLTVSIDAITGEILQGVELQDRKGNKRFDYGSSESQTNLLIDKKILAKDLATLYNDNTLMITCICGLIDKTGELLSLVKEQCKKDKFNPGLILAYLYNKGYTQSYIERVLDLKQKSLSDENFLKLPETICLLKMISTYPWLLKVAESDFTMGVITDVILKEALEALKEVK